MKSFGVLVFVCACALSSASYMRSVPKVADNEVMMKQKAIFELLHHPQQLLKLDTEINLKQQIGNYQNPEVVNKFMQMWEKGMLLTNDETFSATRREHIKQVSLLTHLMMDAKDWETQYNTMKWARAHINSDMFIYALTVTVLHDQKLAGLGLILPAIYEIKPNHFFMAETIEKAQKQKMQGFPMVKKTDNMFNVVINTNYTTNKVITNQEQRMAYFTEDIGINSWYYYFNMDYPFWMNEDSSISNDRRGELYLWQQWQLLKRYYLERMSAGLGEIPEFSWFKEIPTGYYPSLKYSNGDHFPSRENSYKLYTQNNYAYVESVIAFENRLMDTIDRGFLMKPDGTMVNISLPQAVEELGKMMRPIPHTPYMSWFGPYDLFARYLLGASIQSVDTTTTIPSVLQQYETSLRDPMFYQFTKRMIKKYLHWQTHLPHYTKEELNFDGVEIKSVEMDRLITYFEKFDADITNAVDVTQVELTDGVPDNFVIWARNWRLNHMPFTVTMNIKSTKAQKAVVQIFMATKYDQNGHPLTMSQNRENFWQMDKWIVDLNEGLNTIKHGCSEFTEFVKDRTPYSKLYKMVMQASSGKIQLPLDMTEAHCGFPQRMLLPRGAQGGMPFQFFVMVSPYVPPKKAQYTGFDPNVSCGVGSGARYVDDRPFGWPFDRVINMQEWSTPNMYMYETKIYHKTEAEINSPLSHH